MSEGMEIKHTLTSDGLEGVTVNNKHFIDEIIIIEGAKLLGNIVISRKDVEAKIAKLAKELKNLVNTHDPTLEAKELSDAEIEEEFRHLGKIGRVGGMWYAYKQLLEGDDV